MLAFVKGHLECDWPASENEYRLALSLNPSDAYAHFFYSNSQLSPFGRHDEAIAEMKKAIDLDPFSPPVQSFLGRTYLWARRYDEALAQFRKTDQMFPNFVINHERIAHLYTYTGNFDGAIAEETKARLLDGEDPREVSKKEAALRKALAARGPHGYWEKILEFSDAPPNPPEFYEGPLGHALIYTRLGNKQKALDSLEQAFNERRVGMTEIAVEPAYEPLHNEPRYQNLLRRVGLVQ
jgi:serine/threonine-protein kinase